MTPIRAYSIGLLFTVAAGTVDAVSFIELGGYYAAFVSGNTTQLGVSLFHPVMNAALPAAIVALFFLGSFLGSYVHLVGGAKGASRTSLLVVLVMAVSIAMFALGAPHLLASSLLGLAMGVQNAILPMAGAARLGATFVTGSLFGAGQDLARSLLGRAPQGRWLQHLGVWASLLAGAALGSGLYFFVGWWTLGFAMFVYGVCALTVL